MPGGSYPSWPPLRVGSAVGLACTLPSDVVQLLLWLLLAGGPVLWPVLGVGWLLGIGYGRVGLLGLLGFLTKLPEESSEADMRPQGCVGAQHTRNGATQLWPATVATGPSLVYRGFSLLMDFPELTGCPK